MARLSAIDGQIDGPVRGLAVDGLFHVTGFATDGQGNLALTGGPDATSPANELVVLDATGAVTSAFDTGAETIRAVAIEGGSVALALGAGTSGSPPVSDTSRTLVRGYDLATGAQTYESSVAVDSRQPVRLDLGAVRDETLEALGLPSGALKFGDTDSLTDRTGLRPGDHFFVVVNGTRERRIDITQGETLRTLSAKINRTLLNDGRSEVRLTGGANSLSITPARGDRIELRAGKGVSDALRQLGLDAGIAMERSPAAGATRSVSDPPPVVALELPDRADVSTVEKAKSFKDSIEGTLRRIRMGYREISNDPTMVELRRQQSQGSQPRLSAAASQYYNAQISNGQEALRRLGVSA